MNQDTLSRAAEMAGIEPGQAHALSQSLGTTFDPLGPYATRIAANALEALLAMYHEPAEVHFVPKLAEFANALPADPTNYHAYDGPVLLVQSKKAKHTLAFAALPGARGVVVGIFSRAPLKTAEHLGTIREPDELPRYFDHPGFAGAPAPVKEPSEEFERQAALAAVIAYHQVLKTTPPEVQNKLEDFPGQVEDEVCWVAGLEEFPQIPLPEDVPPKVQNLADKIASEAFLALHIYYYIGTGQARLYLLERFGRLVPDRASEPGVLAVAPLNEVKIPRWLRGTSFKLKPNFGIPLRATTSDRGNDALATESPYLFGSKSELEQTLKELGGTPLAYDPQASVGEIIDAILEKKGQPRP